MSFMYGGGGGRKIAALHFCCSSDKELLKWTAVGDWVSIPPVIAMRGDTCSSVASSSVFPGKFHAR